MRLAVAAAAATGVQVGMAIVATRFVVDELGPSSLGFLRYLIGVAVLLPLVIARRRLWFAPRDVLPIALLGIGQFGVLIALLNYALLYITSARAALIFATAPLLAMVFAALLGRQAITARTTLGVSLTIVGVALALGDKAIGAGTLQGEWPGVAAAFGSALVGAVCAVLYRPYLDRYPTIEVSAFAMAASVLVLGCAAVFEGVTADLPLVSEQGWLAVLFIGVSSGVGYVLWLYALGHAPPTQTTAFLSLSPLTAAVLGAWLLDEPLTTGIAAGLACVLGGLWLALWRRPSAAST